MQVATLKKKKNQCFENQGSQRRKIPADFSVWTHVSILVSLVKLPGIFQSNLRITFWFGEPHPMGAVVYFLPCTQGSLLEGLNVLPDLLYCLSSPEDNDLIQIVAAIPSRFALLL